MKMMITILVIPLFALLLSPLLCVAKSTTASQVSALALTSSVDVSAFANAAPAAPLNDAERTALELQDQLAVAMTDAAAYTATASCPRRWCTKTRWCFCGPC